MNIHPWSTFTLHLNIYLRLIFIPSFIVALSITTMWWPFYINYQGTISITFMVIIPMNSRWSQLITTCWWLWYPFKRSITTYRWLYTLLRQYLTTYRWCIWRWIWKSSNPYMTRCSCFNGQLGAFTKTQSIR